MMKPEDIQKMAAGLDEMVKSVMDAPLRLIDPSRHAEYKKDIATYNDLLVEKRDVEAAAFAKKLTTKYDTPDGV